MSAPEIYDFVIVGAGVGGLHLAYQMSVHPFFKNKQIAIVDASFHIHNTNDKLLSFWEKGSGNWDSLLFQSWKQIKFQSPTCEKVLNANPYTYKTLRFKDFSTYCLSIISEKSNFHLITDTVAECTENLESVVIYGEHTTLVGKVVFDSRISKKYQQIVKQKNKQFPSVIQSFKGFEIKFNAPVFNPDCFTMMDYRLQYQQSNSFMYILPKSDTQALLEFTFFAPFTVSDKEYESLLHTYLQTYYPSAEFQILDTEKGEIPMTTYPFSRDSSSKIIKIGTAGGWVKPSTGYSFKFSEKKAASIVSDIVKQRALQADYTAKRFKFYDKLFIKLLQNQNTLGPNIFEEMYKKNTAQDLFAFLDEETSLIQELKFISKLPYLPFLKELFRV